MANLLFVYGDIVRTRISLKEVLRRTHEAGDLPLGHSLFSTPHSENTDSTPTWGLASR